MLKLRGSGDIKETVAEHLIHRGGLGGRRAIDLPAGRGRLAWQLRQAGALVEAYDLFPGACEFPELDCRHADLRGTLPIPDDHAELVLCVEAIEHLPDPLHLLEELARILRPGGVLLLTTPNVSNLRARASHLLLESELYNRLAPSELDGIWFEEGQNRYLGHLFLIGAQRLRTLASLAGLRVRRVLPVKASRSSLLLAWLYPLLVLTSLFAAWRTRRRLSDAAPEQRQQVLRDQLWLNLHPLVLFGKHLFLELEKQPAVQPRSIIKRPTTIR